MVEGAWPADSVRVTIITIVIDRCTREGGDAQGGVSRAWRHPENGGVLRASEPERVSLGVRLAVWEEVIVMCLDDRLK